MVLIYATQYIFIKMEKRFVSHMTEDNFTVMWGRQALYAGNAIILLGLVLVVIGNVVQEPNIGLSIFAFSFFVAIGLPLILVQLSSKIIVEGSQVTAKLLFRRSFTFTFAEINQITVSRSSLSGHSFVVQTTSGNTLKVSELKKHFDKFLAKLEKHVPHLCPRPNTNPIGVHPANSPLNNSFAAHDQIKVSGGRVTIAISIFFIIIGALFSLMIIVGYLIEPVPEDLDLFIIFLAIGLLFIVSFSILLRRTINKRKEKRRELASKANLATHSSRFCTNCGTHVNSAANSFCIHCGGRVVTPSP